MLYKVDNTSAYNYEFSWYVILGMITTVYIAFFNISIDYNLLWTLPFFYTLFTWAYHVSISGIDHFTDGIIFRMSNLFIFIRYVITPFSMVLSSAYNGMGYGPNPLRQTIDFSYFLMIIELASIYIITYIALKYYSKLENKKMNYRNNYFFKNKMVLTIFIIVGILLVLSWDPSTLLPQVSSFINSGDNLTETLDTSSGTFTHIMNIVSNALRVSIFLLLLSTIQKKYKRNKKRFYIVLAWLLVAWYLSTIISSSRWTLLFSVLVIMTLMVKLFPETPRIVYILIATLAVVGLIIISIDKYSWSVRNSENVFRDIINVLFGQFQEYFSGPRVVAQSVEMSNFYDTQIGLDTLVNDFLGSVPGVANYIEQTNRINVVFNNFLNVGNTSHIIPMVGMGYSYFPLFPVIFTVIFEWFVIKFNVLQVKTPNIEFKYIYGFIGLFFAMTIGFNVQIIWGNFLTNFVPLWILFTVNRKIRF